MLSLLAWLSVWSKLHVISIWSSLYHCHPVISCVTEIQNRLSFWYHLTQVIPEKRPWNECLCFFYFNHVCRRFLAYHCQHFYVNIRNPLSNRNFWLVVFHGWPSQQLPGFFSVMSVTAYRKWKGNYCFAVLLSAQCMLTYWEIRNRLSAVRCPSCRQQVTVSLSLLYLTFWNLFLPHDAILCRVGR